MLNFLKTQNFLIKNTNSFIHKTNKNNQIPFQLSKTPRRYNSNMRNMFDMIPPITKFILGCNAFIYGIGFFMSQGDYIKQFFYHRMAINHSKYHVLLTSHFAKGNFFDFAIDSLITFAIGRNLEIMLGYQAFLKLVLTSIGIGSVILLTMHNEQLFIKSDSITRAMIMFLVMRNPTASFYLFPLPISIPGYVFGIIIILLDYITSKWVNFGGTAAALLMIKGLI